MLRLALIAFAMGFGFSTRAEITREERVRGSFLGLAYGDARGLLTRGFRPGQIERLNQHDSSRATEPSAAAALSVGGKKRLGRMSLPGFVSDPTAQAMALQLALAHYPDWGEAGARFFTRLLIETYRRRAHRGTDRVYAKAVKRLVRGVDRRRSGVASPSLSAAVRVGAIAGLGQSHMSGNPVRESSLITYADHRAVMLSEAVYAINALLMKGLSPSHVLRTIPVLLAQFEPGWLDDDTYLVDRSEAHSLLAVLEKVFARLPECRSTEEVSALVREATKPYVSLENDRTYDLNDQTALVGGIHAIALALGPHAEPFPVLEYIASLGGESNAVAALAGSVLGARFGTDWIPHHWLADRARLERYADALVSGGIPETFPEYVAREFEIGAKTRAFREMLLESCGSILEN